MKESGSGATLVAVSVTDPLIQASLIGEALDKGPALVFVADEDMRYVAVNALACETLGYTRAELLELKVTDVCRYDAAPAEYEAMLQAQLLEGEATLSRKDGTTVGFRYLAGETRMAGMLFYVSVGRTLA
jgi:PAS domain S-box-containing protein